MEAHSDERATSQAARRRLVLAADDELRDIERELHGGLQQHLVALSVELQLVRAIAESDPAAALLRLDELERDVGGALGEAGRLARRIYGPPPEAGAIGAELRAAAEAAGVAVEVDVELDGALPHTVLRTVFAGWLAALDGGGSGRPTISVRTEDSELVFEVAGIAAADARLGRLRDRVEALGGSLAVVTEPGDTVRIRGALPLEESAG